jgi:hypothetical protein
MMIKINRPACVTLILLGLTAGQTFAAAALSPADKPLFSAVPNGSITTAFMFDFGSRVLEDDGVGYEFDSMRITGRLGYSPASWVNLYVSAGYTRAEYELTEGQGGLTADAGILLNLFEFPIENVGMISTRQSIGITVDTTFTYSESNFSEADFNWTEISVIPTIQYRVDRSGRPTARAYDAQAAALRGGLIFDSIDADFGDRSLCENRNFGFLLAGDVMLSNLWVGTLSMNYYDNDDRTVRILFGRYF